MITLTIFVFVVLFSLIKYILHIRRLESYVKHLNCRKTAFPLLGVFPFIIGKNRNQIYNEFIEFTLANETPIKAYFGPQLFIALDKPEDVKTIVMSPNCLGKTYNYDFFPVPHGILPERSPVLWKPLRKHLNPLFTLNKLQSFIPILNEKSKIFVQGVNDEVGKSQFDCLSYAKTCTLSAIFVTMMEIEIDMKSIEEINYIESIEAIFRIMIERFSAPWAHFDFIFRWSYMHKEFKKQSANVRSVTNAIFEHHTKDYYLNKNDEKEKPLIMSLFFKRKLGEENVKQQIENFIIAGYDTTATTMSYTILLLAMHPDIQDQVFNELRTVYEAQDEETTYAHFRDLNLLDRVIKESMRLFPVAPSISRTAGCDIPVSNCVIPKDTFVLLSIYTMHRKKETWGEDADKFNPDNFLPERVQLRHPFAYLPFSRGPRNCIAYQYAMFSLKVMLSAALRHYKFSTNLALSDLQLEYEVTLKLCNKHMVSAEKRHW